MAAVKRNDAAQGIATGGVRLRFADVLALATCTSPWSPAITTGAAIAADHGSNLTGCYVPAPLRSLAGCEEPGPLMPEQRDEMEREGVDEPAAFPCFAHSLGIRNAAWIVTRSPVAPTLRKLGGWHDLIVLERDMVEPEQALDLLGEALRGCRVPCLILPPRWNGPATFHRIVVGWNGSAEATRALHGALPMLQLARHVILVDGEIRTLDDDPLGASHPDPIVYLRHHQVEAALQYIHASSETAGATLLHKAREAQADLLVMGAYSHSRIRECLLGGATRHVILHADLPVLMQH
jgi:nucleotide-binding universal stress UspA family protein